MDWTRHVLRTRQGRWHEEAMNVELWALITLLDFTYITRRCVSVYLATSTLNVQIKMLRKTERRLAHFEWFDTD